MKKYSLMIIMLFACIMIVAQNTWKCPEYDSDLEKYNEICKEFKSIGNKRWAKELLNAFPIASDNTIKYQYVIKSDSTFNVEDISNSLLSWYKIKMPNVVPNPTGAKEKLSAIAVLQHVGKAIGYMNATFISAREEVTIDIKDNRVRVTVIILNYIGANTWQGVQNIAPGGCFPVDPKGAQKDSHAMAFINCHCDALNTVSSIIKHLNDNSKSISNGEEEW